MNNGKLLNTSTISEFLTKALFLSQLFVMYNLNFSFTSTIIFFSYNQLIVSLNDF